MKAGYLYTGVCVLRWQGGWTGLEEKTVPFVQSDPLDTKGTKACPHTTLPRACAWTRVTGRRQEAGLERQGPGDRLAGPGGLGHG